MKNQEVKQFIDNEQIKYDLAFAKKDFQKAFQHLERIHILSQSFPIAHTLIHLRMLKFAIATSRPLEIIIQFLYSLFSAKFSMLNIFPKGNTGGVNAIFKGKMSIPEDLNHLVN
jgi:hypothetical protein